MSQPIIKSGRFHVGKDCKIGEGVVIDVAEEVVLGDRCVLGNNTYLCGRCISIGDDFFGYSHWNKRLEVGLGRRDEEDAVLTVGSRCTMHDNKIDLARRVTIGNDVGLSPEVTIYTHGYWMSVLEGNPCRRLPVDIGNKVIVGYRSTILAGVSITHRTVIGAGAVVASHVTTCGQVWIGNPAKFLRYVSAPNETAQQRKLVDVVGEWERSLVYRNLLFPEVQITYPYIVVGWGALRIMPFRINVEAQTIEGTEDEYSDDLRWHLFTNGIRVYTQRSFAKLPMRKQ